MLLGFLAATFSISLGFVVSFAIMRVVLGEGAWKSLGALAEAGWAAAETCWRYRRRLTSANPQWRMHW